MPIESIKKTLFFHVQMIFKNQKKKTTKTNSNNKKTKYKPLL